MTTSNPLAPHDPTPLSPGDLIDERKTAAILSVSVQTLRNWRWRGDGPRWRKLGKRVVRYHRADLAAFIEGKAGEA
ncbi:helix-turn-helix domain-containing protein [Oleiagrimonas sp.]|jgi:predicted DNA-binding transcriptional regulator AlpA|uniref:helix-turn-helix transcriptional regulator n=1 Tax=Oleiagrimonas sp. TaxID=2010330 RepID=UPI00260D4285|nr:helix-turn-helix domain-containing protein [Oleiagrimonas sp.]MDA3913117.1 helix-turn-helix domain-containing protein [Oleiagrimonas sp.]